MRKLHFILLPLIAFALLACSEDDSSPTTPTETQVLMPLAVGNYWIYNRMVYTSGDYRFTRSDTASIVDEVSDSIGVLWYVDDHFKSYRNTSQGLDFLLGTWLFRLKYPAAVGEFFAVEPQWLITLQHADTLVTTPLGDFSCLRYGFGRPGQTEERHYYCPGIGRIRYETLHWTYLPEESRYDSVCFSYSELIEYHLE